MVAQNPGREDYSSLLMVCLYQRQKVRHGKTYTCKPPTPRCPTLLMGAGRGVGLNERVWEDRKSNHLPCLDRAERG